MSKFDWKSVPKQAIVETMKTLGIAPANVSKASKDSLVADAQKHMTDNPDQIDDFHVRLQNEIDKLKSAPQAE